MRNEAVFSEYFLELFFLFRFKSQCYCGAAFALRYILLFLALLDLNKKIPLPIHIPLELLLHKGEVSLHLVQVDGGVDGILWSLTLRVQLDGSISMQVFSKIGRHIL